MCSFALLNFIKELSLQNAMTQFLAILCAKGGVGKTTTTVHLAGAFLTFGRDVIAIDADFTAPNLSLYLGVPALPRSIHTALLGTVRLSDCLYFHPSGLRIIPGNIAYESTKNIPLQLFKSALQDLQHKADIVLVDGAPGVSPEAKTVIEAVDAVIAITTPDLAAVSDTRKTIKMAQEQNKPVLGVIINRVRGEEHEIPAENIQTFLDVPVLGTIPEDSSVRTAYQLKGPIHYTHPGTPIADAYKKIAAHILEEHYEPTLAKKEVPSLSGSILKGWRVL